MNQYHPVVQRITDLLKDNGCWFATFEHEPVRTSEEAAQVRHGYTIEQGTKAIIVGAKKGRKRHFVMLVVPGDRRFDAAKVKALLGTGDIRFATEEEIGEITGGVLVGGIPPFGNLFGLPVYVDPHVLEQKVIIFNAGDRRFSVAMHSADYKRLVEPQIVQIVS